jgi:magnesium-transporting ATPase (P-type)
MNAIQTIVLFTMFILLIICYFKIGWNSNNKEQDLYLILLFFIATFSIFLLMITIDSQNKAKKQLNAKFPKLEKVENVYRIINK